VLGLLSRPAVAFTTAVAVVGMYVFQSFVSFFPTFLIEFRGFSTGDASLAFGAVFLLSAIGQPIVGRLSDTFSRDLVLASVMVLAAVGFVVALAGESVIATLVAVGLLGSGLTYFGATNARVMDNFGEEDRAAGFGLARTLLLFLGAQGSVVTGTLADVAGWTAAFAVTVGLLVLTSVALVSNRRLGLGL
jgi:MFS family permease